MNTLSILAAAALAATAAQSAAGSAAELEPNNRSNQANLIDWQEPLTGELSTQDIDYFRISLNDQDTHRDIIFSLDDDIRTDTCLHEADGTRITCVRGTQHGFPGLTLQGEYLLSISPVTALESTVSYQLQVGAATANLPGHEVEPNDRWGDATALTGEHLALSGTLAAGDRDVLRVSIPGPRRHWRIAVTGASVYAMELRTGGGVALQTRSGKAPLALSGLYLPPGEYLLALTPPAKAERGEYEVNIAPMALSADDVYEHEPNDTSGQAQRLTPGTPYVGMLSRRDTDMYRFHLPGSARVRVHAASTSDSKLSLNLDGQNVGTADAGDAIFEGTVPGGDHLLRLRGRPAGSAEYRLQVDLVDPLTADQPTLEDVSVAILGEIPTVAAYHPLGQRLPLDFEVSNTGSEPRTLELLSRTSDVGWRLSPQASTVRVEPGERKRVEAVLDVLPDARADIAALLSLGVRSADGAVASVSHALQAACGESPVNPRRLWPLPDALLGGTNAAWSGLGATIVDQTRYNTAGTDGIVTRTTGAWMPAPGDVTVALAGDQPLSVLGTVIHPTGSGKVGVQARRFELHLSDDGEQFRQVLAGILSSDAVEQAFVLPAPQSARFARLRLIDNIAQDGRAIGFGEWKVIVAESPREILGEAVNIAAHPLGGHTAYSLPYAGGGCCHTTFNTAKQDGQFASADDHYEWVMGFRDNRAARIERLRWLDGEGLGAHRRAIQRVRVDVSMESPVGPWTALADWALRRERADVAELPLEAPVWARFVRFRAEALASTAPYTPAQVQIFEAAGDANYRSVVGEWGHGSPEGPYERQLPTLSVRASQVTDAGGTRETATPSDPGGRISGTVLVGEDEDWYAITVPNGSHRLRLRLLAARGIEYAFELLDAQGTPLETDSLQSDDALEVSAFVPAGTYFLRLYEPPRSVIFSWDTSGSVGPYYDVIDHTMKAFAAGIRTGREEVNLVPFNDPMPAPMLDHWSGDAHEVSATIVASDRRFGSSNAETALLVSTDTLSKREGTRAVLFITDAETDGLKQTGALWRRLAEVRPRIFSFELSSKGNPVPQDMMQNYAAVNRGYYDLALTAGDLQIGFDRAICMLRRPKAYEVDIDLEPADPPQPGALLVKAQPNAAGQRVAAGDAVEVIVDASGSMYKKLGDRFRYQIAADVLDELLADVLPEGVGFALRAFGNREASSCRTDLEVRLGPLDRGAAREVVRAITPQAFAYTPIADAIAKVPEDLAGASGRKTVVLITDGEESCDGDVEAQIAALTGLGVDVQLNVIGFDFDADDADTARATFQRWAALGGGSYFDATSASELARSVSLATSVVLPFEVRASNDRVVAAGAVNGAEVPLPPGRYTVHFADDAHPVEQVEITSRNTTTLTLD